MTGFRQEERERKKRKKRAVGGKQGSAIGKSVGEERGGKRSAWIGMEWNRKEGRGARQEEVEWRST